VIGKFGSAVPIVEVFSKHATAHCGHHRFSRSVILSAARRQPSGVEGPLTCSRRDDLRELFEHGPYKLDLDRCTPDWVPQSAVGGFGGGVELQMAFPGESITGR